jgi:16S rRNA (guanine966-N2)-methyltransferase
VRDLRATLDAWAGAGGEVRRADALALLAGPPEPFDVVFLDPPFASTLLADAASRLTQDGWLAPGALIYAEAAARAGLPPLPASWQLLKAKQAGEVGYHLLRHEP